MNSEIVREGVAAGLCDAAEENQNRGLTLTPRDHFAIAALQGFLASDHDSVFETYTPEVRLDYANMAYAFADSMLAAREVKTPTKSEGT